MRFFMLIFLFGCSKNFQHETKPKPAYCSKDYKGSYEVFDPCKCYELEYCPNQR